MKSKLFSRSFATIVVMIASTSIWLSAGAQTVVFSESFEGTSHKFTVVNGTEANKWAVDTAVAAGGSAKSAYISTDGGAGYGFDDTIATYVHLYANVSLPASVQPYRLSFEWMCKGRILSKSNSIPVDYMRIRLASASEMPVAGTSFSAGKTVGLYNASTDATWQADTVELAAFPRDTTLRLVFSWINARTGLGSSPKPIALDNVKLTAVPVVSKTVNILAAGSLKNRLSATEKSSVTHLTLNGKFDARDVQFMRDSMTALAVLDLSGASIASYNGTEGTVAMQYYYSSNNMPRNSFYNATTGVSKLSLISVKFPETMYNINPNAFRGCTGLSGVLVLPEKTMSILDSAFYGCKLTGLDLSENCYGIYRGAFAQNTALAQIICRNPNPTYIDSTIFSGVNKNICVVKVFNANAYRAHEWWKEFKNIQSLGICKSLECTPGNLKNLIPDAEKNLIDSLALTGVVDARDIAYLRDSLPVLHILHLNTQIQAYTGSSGTAEGSRDYPANTIPVQAFSKNYTAKRLMEVTLANGIQSIDTGAFAYCPLHKFSFPAKLLSIGNSAFEGSQLFNLESPLALPKGVKHIGSYAFYDVGRTAIVLPDSLITMGDYAFWADDYYIGALIIPTKVTRIEASTFFGNNPTSVELPAGLTHIGENGFGSTVAQYVISHNPVPPTLESDAFMYFDRDTCVIRVPSIAAVAAYRAAAWSKFKQIEKIACLHTLSTNVGTLSPIFSASDTAYTINVSNSISSITISATARYGTTITGDAGAKTLNVGKNTFTLTATSADGKYMQTYTVVVKRASTTAGNDANLKSLTVSEGTLTPAFSASSTTYMVALPNSVTEIILTAAAQDSNATVSGDGTKELSTGLNTFTIKVTAENGATKNYTVNVNCAKSSDASLKSMSLTNYAILSPAFHPDTLNYTASVKNTYNNTTIRATANHAAAIVTGTGGHMLNVGKNTLSVVVIAEDGATMRTYTIEVTRPSSTASSDATLSNLTVSAGTLAPTFSSTTTDYTVTVENTVTSITLTATKNHSEATVSGDGEKTLNVGVNNFDIIVTAEDVTTKKTYTVVVTRSEGSGIEDAVAEQRFAMYPNPVTDELTIDFGTTGKGGFQTCLYNGTIEIYDVKGVIVAKHAINAEQSKMTINVSKLKIGTYIIRIGDVVGRFVKK